MKLLITEKQLIFLKEHYDYENDFENLYRSYKQQEIEEPIGYIDNTAIYKNPKSLKNFSADVRAIADNKGNIYVAFNDARFAHGDISRNLGLGDVYANPNLIGLHRIEKTNSFGLSDAETNNLWGDTDIYYRKEFNRLNKILTKTKIKNPHFSFFINYYQDVII